MHVETFADFPFGFHSIGFQTRALVLGVADILAQQFVSLHFCIAAVVCAEEFLEMLRICQKPDHNGPESERDSLKQHKAAAGGTRAFASNGAHDQMFDALSVGMSAPITLQLFMFTSLLRMLQAVLII